MSHTGPTSGLQHHTQGVWQSANSATAAGIQDNAFANDVFDRGPPLAIQENNSYSDSPAHQPTNFIHSPSLTRGTKSHRYMTRQTQHQEQMQNNGQLPSTTFRPLPFYDEACILIPPTAMDSYANPCKENHSVISFTLTVDQADHVAMASDKIHIVLRFCHIDMSCEQDDNFPPDVKITVNGHHMILPPAIVNPNKPNQVAKRPGQHVDITKFCKLSPYNHNEVSVKWNIDPSEPTKGYATTVIIGERVSSTELLTRIKDKGLTDPEETKKLFMGSDSEVATTGLQCSLMCPLGQMKMTTPCKSVRCQHYRCFDGLVYLQMNEKKPKWECPVCTQPTYFPDLVIDGYFTDIIQKTASNVTDVNLNLDGTWDPVLKTEQQAAANHHNPPPEVICISSDEE